MSTYAAYYNLNEADKTVKVRRSSSRSVSSTESNHAQPEQRKVSASTFYAEHSRQYPSRPPSPNSSNGQREQHKSSFTRFLHSFRPADEVSTPTGVYSPVIKRGSLFSRRSSQEEKERRVAAGKDIKMSREMRDLVRGAA
jgi:hypothetical protein